MTRLLLAAGANINQLNAVRKHCSLLKGGQLARAAAPARVHALLLSDVIGDPLDVIASGPTAPDASTFADARAILERFDLLARAPASIVDRLDRGMRGEVPETPKPGDPVFRRVTNTVIGNNALVVDAAAARARALGYTPHVLTRSLEGEAREVADRLVALAGQVREGRGPVAAPACVIAGGETTVTVRGKGAGGRCQEFGLAAALALDGQEGWWRWPRAPTAPTGRPTRRGESPTAPPSPARPRWVWPRPPCSWPPAIPAGSWPPWETSSSRGRRARMWWTLPCCSPQSARAFYNPPNYAQHGREVRLADAEPPDDDAHPPGAGSPAPTPLWTPRPATLSGGAKSPRQSQ